MEYRDVLLMGDKVKSQDADIKNSREKDSKRKKPKEGNNLNGLNSGFTQTCDGRKAHSVWVVVKNIFILKSVRNKVKNHCF